MSPFSIRILLALLVFNVNLCLFTTKGENSKMAVKLAHQAFAIAHISENTVPIIILHGLLGSKSNWNSIAKAIMHKTNNRMVITLDARNHGESPHTDEFTYDLMVADLVKFLKEKSIKKASFIGHSMGGRTCMLFALHYPYMVESLVVVDISPFGQSPSMLDLPNLFHKLGSLDIGPFLSVSEARQVATTQLKQRNLDDKLISFLMTNLVANEGVPTWRWKFNLDSISTNFKSEISDFPVINSPFLKPTLFVAGGDSDYLQRKDEVNITRLFTAAKFQYIAGAGHWVHAEKPQEFVSVVSAFLNLDKQ